MIILVDIGNTNIVVGIAEKNKIIRTERIRTSKNKTVFEYSVLLRYLRITDVTGCIISSVVADLTDVIKRAVQQSFDVDPFVVKPGIKTGLNILIENPKELGSDLIVGAVGAVSKLKTDTIAIAGEKTKTETVAGTAEKTKPENIVVIDIGTATTFCVVKGKNIVGVIILPGLNICMNVLSEVTSLPTISFEKPPKVIGTNTVDSMRSGMLYGYVSSIDGILERIVEEIPDIVAVATGGISKLIIPHCKSKIILEEDLLLEGLIVLYNKNR
jgi:type III pantothenate kinase